MSHESTKLPPVSDPNVVRQLRQLQEAIERIIQGKTYNHGTVTLAASTTQTTLADRRLGADSTVLLSPESATASVDFKDVYISSKDKEKAVITHPNTADTDKIFGYIIIG